MKPNILFRVEIDFTPPTLHEDNLTQKLDSRLENYKHNKRQIVGKIWNLFNFFYSNLLFS